MRIARPTFTYTQADHGGARGTLPRYKVSGVEYPHICDAFPHILLCTHRGGGLVGCADTKGTQLWSDLPDAHQRYPVLTAGALSIRSVGSSRFRSDREDNGEKQVRGQGERVIIP